MLCGGSPGTPRLQVFLFLQLLVGRCLNLSLAALPRLQWSLLGASALDPLGPILNFINLGRALRWVAKVLVGIKISTLVSPNRDEPLRELGDILFDNVGRLPRELPSVISAMCE